MLLRIKKTEDGIYVFDDDDMTLECVKVEDYNGYIRNGGVVETLGVDVEIKYCTNFYAVYFIKRTNTKYKVYFQVYTRGGKRVLFDNLECYYPVLNVEELANAEFFNVRIAYTDKHYYGEDIGETFACEYIVDKKGLVASYHDIERNLPDIREKLGI